MTANDPAKFSIAPTSPAGAVTVLTDWPHHPA